MKLSTSSSWVLSLLENSAHGNNPFSSNTGLISSMGTITSGSSPLSSPHNNNATSSHVITSVKGELIPFLSQLQIYRTFKGGKKILQMLEEKKNTDPNGALYTSNGITRNKKKKFYVGWKKNFFFLVNS
jgi:hypothetical protein